MIPKGEAATSNVQSLSRSNSSAQPKDKYGRVCPDFQCGILSLPSTVVVINSYEIRVPPQVHSPSYSININEAHMTIRSPSRRDPMFPRKVDQFQPPCQTHVLLSSLNHYYGATGASKTATSTDVAAS